MLNHSSWLSLEEMDLVVISFFLKSISKSSTENIFIFLFGEVLVIISMWMRILSWVIPVILPSWIRSQVLWMSKGPVFNFKITDWSSIVVVAHSHCSFVSLVVDSFSSQEPLSLFSKTFKNMIWANFHNWDFLVHAVFLTICGGASIVLSDFSIATLWNEIWLQDHIFWVHHIWLAERTVLVT